MTKHEMLSLAVATVCIATNFIGLGFALARLRKPPAADEPRTESRPFTLLDAGSRQGAWRPRMAEAFRPAEAFTLSFARPPGKGGRRLAQLAIVAIVLLVFNLFERGGIQTVTTFLADLIAKIGW